MRTNPPPPVDDCCIATTTPNLTPGHRFLWKLAGVVAMLILALHAVGPWLSAAPQDPAAPRTAAGSDFLIGYAAGSLAREGRFDELHDRVALMARVREISAAHGIQTGGPIGPWMNPPFFLWPFMALSRLPYPAALWTWWLASAAAVAGACALIVRMLQPAVDTPRPLRTPAAPDPSSLGSDWRTWALVPVLVILSMPALQTFTHGQSSGFGLLLVAATVTLWRRGCGLEAGLVAGLLAYKPQLALILWAVLVIDQGRRAILGLAVTLGTLFALCVVLTPDELELHVKHAPAVASAMQADGVFPWHRHATLASFWRLLLQGDAAGTSGRAVRAATAVCAAAMVAALAAVLLRGRRPGLTTAARTPAAMAARRDRLIALSIAVTPLLMPYFMDYDLLILAVPGALVAGGTMRGATGRASAVAAWAGTGLFVWCYVNPGVTATTGINVSVAILVAAIVAIMSGSMSDLPPARSAAPASPAGSAPFLPVNFR